MSSDAGELEDAARNLAALAADLTSAEVRYRVLCARLADRYGLEPEEVRLAGGGIGGVTFVDLVRMGGYPRPPHPPPSLPPTPRADLYAALVIRDGEHCQECGTTADLQVDHIMPRALGGGDWLPNRQLLCGPCNLRKRAKHPDVWRAEVAAGWVPR